jgi:small subunit ribosomal protein S3
MGQKVSPIGMRVGVIRDWNSRWYAEKKDFSDLLNEDVRIHTYLEKELKDAYISRIEIERAGKKDVKVIIRCARPGAVIGKSEDGKAEKMEKIKAGVGKIANGKAVKIDVIQVANPDLDARLVARKICEQLENRQSFRVTQKKAIQQTMRSGAKGIKTLCKGRLGGAEIARQEGYAKGVVPLHTLRSDIDYACEEAHTTYGKLGVKVWICRGEVMPGEMVKEPEAPKGGMRDRRGGRRNNRRFDSRRRDNSGNAANANANTAAAPEKAAPEKAAPAEGGNN